LLTQWDVDREIRNNRTAQPSGILPGIELMVGEILAFARIAQPAGTAQLIGELVGRRTEYRPALAVDPRFRPLLLARIAGKEHAREIAHKQRGRRVTEADTAEILRVLGIIIKTGYPVERSVCG